MTILTEVYVVKNGHLYSDGRGWVDRLADAMRFEGRGAHEYAVFHTESFDVGVARVVRIVPLAPTTKKQKGE